MASTEKIVLIGAGSLQFGLGSVGNMLRIEADYIQIELD